MKAILLSLFLFPLGIAAQQTIRGRVVDDSLGTPIAAASVFVNNTSKGTVTDSHGQFILTDVPSGKHELIISSIGYATNVFPFTNGQLPLQLKIELHVRVREMQAVVVEPSVEEGWDKWGKMFTSNFLGTTPNALQCRIKNTGDIKFRHYKKSNRVIAYADKPIEIENNALGYDISYQLEEFEVNFREGSTFYVGYPLYKDRNEGKSIKPKWQKKREACWKGSIMHFMYSLYNDQLAEEGFLVRRMVRRPNMEKKRVRTLYESTKMITRRDANTGQAIYQLGFPDFPPDSAAYYKIVLGQPDLFEDYGASLLTADSLIIDSNATHKAMYFDNYLYITFTREKEEMDYVLTMPGKKSPGNQLSYVTLLEQNIILLDRYGNYVNPRYFFTSGYWAWSEKMGDTLPLDYLQTK